MPHASTQVSSAKQVELHTSMSTSHPASSPSSTAAQVRVLVEEGGANFDARDGYSMDPLDEAMRHRHDEVAQFLQSHGALVGGRNPL